MVIFLRPGDDGGTNQAMDTPVGMDSAGAAGKSSICHILLTVPSSAY